MFVLHSIEAKVHGIASLEVTKFDMDFKPSSRIKTIDEKETNRILD